MQIEEEFRYIKSCLFGLGFEHHKSWYIHRIAVLNFIATFARILANIICLATSIVYLHRRYKRTQLRQGEYHRFTFRVSNGIESVRVHIVCSFTTSPSIFYKKPVTRLPLVRLLPSHFLVLVKHTIVAKSGWTGKFFQYCMFHRRSMNIVKL